MYIHVCVRERTCVRVGGRAFVCVCDKMICVLLHIDNYTIIAHEQKRQFRDALSTTYVSWRRRSCPRQWSVVRRRAGGWTAGGPAVSSHGRRRTPGPALDSRVPAQTGRLKPTETVYVHVQGRRMKCP